MTKAKESIKEFITDQVTPIEELSCTLSELTHARTGARVIHVGCEDLENVFCIGLTTWPDSHNGAPHILEHTVLCGSKKFPVKDPFFGMTRRSLNTFMNAFTGADFTCYPAASMVEKDFYNLLEVYCDAVFFPELKELSFLQEGHRFAFLRPNDPSSPLIYQGIVYNEMKGGMSSPDSRLWQAIHQHLLPDLPYAFNSGGDPKEIPNLTYQGLKDFHAKYYHPSRAIFYFYGNLPLEQHLHFLNTHVLDQVECKAPLPPTGKQKRFQQPRQATESYPAKEGDRTIAAFCYLTCTPKEMEESLALSLLDSILMGHDGSFLKRALLTKGYCTMADGCLDTEMSEIPYVIICRGCTDVCALDQILQLTLQTLASTGIDPKIAASALHQMEFDRLEIGGSGFPFGLNLFFRSVLLAQHGGAPLDGLRVYSLLETLRKKIEDPHYLGAFIKKYFLDNPHKLQLSLVPDPDLEQVEASKERARLDAIEKQLSAQQKEAIVAKTQTLMAYQKQSEAQSLDCLPKIQIADVPRQAVHYPLAEHKDGIFFHDTFTNHILYAAITLDLPHLSAQELPYAQLYTSLLTELGARDRDFAQNLEWMQKTVGDIDVSMKLHACRGAPDHLRPALVLQSKALFYNRNGLFSLMRDFIEAARTDEAPRIKELVLQTHTYLQQKLISHSMGYANMLATAHLSKSGAINQYWMGLNYYKFIDELAKNIDARLPELMQMFHELHHKLFHFHQPHLVLSCDKKMYDTLAKENFGNLHTISKRPYTPFSLEPEKLTPQSHGRPIASPVAFTAMGLQTQAECPLLSIAHELFDNKVLHPLIREQGGAYGSGSSYNSVTGAFSFYAYRDPNLSQTIHAFKQAIDTIGSGGFTIEDLDEAKLGLIQAFDTPLYPGSRALTAYNQLRENKTQEFRQAYRDAVLSATRELVIEAVNSHFQHPGCVVSFASKKLLEKENFPILPL